MGSKTNQTTEAKIVMRSSWMCAFAAAAFFGSMGPAAAQSGVQVGVLECRGSGSISFVIGSVHEFTCIFTPGGGPGAFVAAFFVAARFAFVLVTRFLGAVLAATRLGVFVLAARLCALPRFSVAFRAAPRFFR